MSLDRAVEQALDALQRAHHAERVESRERAERERVSIPLDVRVARGVALRAPELDELTSAAGGRIRLWLRPDGALDDVRIRPSEPVLLRLADEPNVTTRAVAGPRDRERLSVVVDGDVDGRFLEGGFHVERDTPEVTFDRGDAALARARTAKSGSPLADHVALLYGDAAPRGKPRVGALDATRSLTPTQARAVGKALGVEPIALLHGPPGTGKTTALVALVMQAVAEGERLLVAAPSHAALDTLGERLLDAGVPLVRLGHPARVSAGMEAASLDERVRRSASAKVAGKLEREAEAVRRKAQRTTGRSPEQRAERRAAFAEAKRLRADARRVLDVEVERELARAKVVLCTLAGAADRLLDTITFDRVVVDEATQAIDPLLLVPLARAPRAVLAGDPEQLPPTVVAAGGAALATTGFERLRARLGEAVCTTLDLQHRMHEVLFAPMNEAFYGGQVATAEAARARTAESLGLRADPGRPGPRLLVDTAGRGYDEVKDDEGSTSNPAQAERTEREVRRLRSRGARPDQLAVLTPYEAQARLLRGRLADLRAEGLEVSTVDGFQGREADVVVVDLVRSNPQREQGFLRDLRRLNVAFTRARGQLIVIGDAATLAGHPFLEPLVDRSMAEGLYVSAWEDDAEPLDPL